MRQLQQDETAEKVSWGWKWAGRKRAEPESVAAAEVTPTPEEATTTQLAQLKEAIRQRARNCRIANFGFCGAAASAILIPLVLLNESTHADLNSSHHTLLLNTLLVLTLGGYASALIHLLRGERRLRQATEALAETEDLRAVGPLIEALRFIGPTHEVAAVVLARLLPRFRAQDAALLDDKQRARLRKELRAGMNPISLSRYNPNFVITLLKTVAEIGDTEALPLVSRLTQRREKSPAAERIRQAAQDCLVRLTTPESSPLSITIAEAGTSERTTVGSELLTLCPDEIESLITQLHQTAQAYKRRFPWLMAGIIAVPIAVIAGFMPVFWGEHINVFLPYLADLFIVSSILGMAYSASRTRGVVSTLAEVEDLRVVGPLIEALEVQDNWLLRLASGTLTRLLPRLQASDASLLNEHQRAILNRRLDWIARGKRDKRWNDFAIAILRALHQVGDQSALPYVQRLASLKVKTPTQAQLRDEAIACLPFLEARVDQERASQTLLRAAEPSASTPDVLLRPASGVSDTAPQVLLRPGSPRDSLSD